MTRPTPGEQQEACIHYDDGCLLSRYEGTPQPEECAECMDYRGPSRGMGDRVANLIKITRLDTLVKQKNSAGEGGCKCGKRRAALNRLVPRKKA